MGATKAAVDKVLKAYLNIRKKTPVRTPPTRTR